jgi:hypothetical protein
MIFYLIIVLFLVTGALFAVAKWREVRADRLMDGEWVMTTTLAGAALRTLIVQGMKGRDPAAKVKRNDSAYEQEIEEVSGNMRNSVTLVAWVERIDGGGSEVHFEIADWEGPRKFGMRMVGSVNICASRIRSVLADIRRADPSAQIVSKPGGK